MQDLPLAVEISYAEPASIFERFAARPWAMLLDSANCQTPFEDTNRYSYIVYNPSETITLHQQQRLENDDIVTNPFEYLKNILSRYSCSLRADLPPFQGGALGYLSYDLCHYIEPINRPAEAADFTYPDLAMGLYDQVIAFDHLLKKAWVIACGFNAEHKLKQCLAELAEPHYSNCAVTETSVDLMQELGKAEYMKLVTQAQDHIRNGDIFEVNISHKFSAKFTDKINAYALYLKMCSHNPAPFSAYLNFGKYKILSNSPERFLLVKNRKVTTRPIKGTAPRGKTLAQDHKLATDLVNSEKNRAENIMITDLLRNDLSRVCTPESVTVTKLCALETFPTLHHLVSIIEGDLKTGIAALDVLAACFPGGSVTGAPKVRAMQIIYELETTPRGPYCGSIGFFGFNGQMDTSIIIRTLLMHDNKLCYQAGGAIILDSCAEEEYAETLVKSSAIAKLLNFKEPA